MPTPLDKHSNGVVAHLEAEAELEAQPIIEQKTEPGEEEGKPDEAEGEQEGGDDDEEEGEDGDEEDESDEVRLLLLVANTNPNSH